MVKSDYKNFSAALICVPLFGVISCSETPSLTNDSPPDVTSRTQSSNKKELSTAIIVSYQKGTSINIINNIDNMLPSHTKKSLSSKTIFLYKFKTIENTLAAKTILTSVTEVENVSNDKVFKINRNYGYK